MKYDVIVECAGNWKQKKFQKTARRYQLTDCGIINGKQTYTGKVSASKYHKIASICTKYKITFKLNNPFAVRSKTYRKTFFDNTKPHFMERYFCAYCGRLVKKENIMVDHIYAVGSVQKSKYTLKKLKSKGYKSVNDIKNLAASCETCNLTKGAKGGIWIIRGKIGKHPSFWCVWHCCRIIIAGCVLFYAYRSGFLYAAVDFFQIIYKEGIEIWKMLNTH